MKAPRLMVVLVMSLGCAAVHPVRPSAAAENEADMTVEPADAFYSDPGTPIAGQRYCWLYYAKPTYLQKTTGWVRCEATKKLVWQHRDHKTLKWVNEE